MKQFLPAIFLLAAAPVFAQTSNDIFAATGRDKQDFVWAQIQPVGKTDVAVNTLGTFMLRSSVQPQSLQAPLGQMGIAALAYDGVHNRLYFSPLFKEGNIVYVDLDAKDGGKNTMVEISAALKIIDRQKDGEGANITRMTIGPDKYGYALSNDGKAFYRFDTKTNKVESLGTLLNNPKNTVSVHEACSCWGGDLVADDQGQLYLFSMYQQVFKIDPASKEATYLGRLSGLPNEFRVNGAAVCEDNSILLSHATATGVAARITNLSDLTANVEPTETMLHASDLASRFVIRTTSTSIGKMPEIRTNPDMIGAYPNPVTANRLMLTFNKVAHGRYTIDMVDGGGATALRNNVQVLADGQVVTLNTARLAKGWYVVRVIDAETHEVWNKKVVLQ